MPHAETNLLTRAHLEDFVPCYRADDRMQREESEQFRRLTYEGLTQRDKANLDIFILRDESWRTPKICRRPTRSPRRIMEDLRAALEQLEEIAGDDGG